MPGMYQNERTKYYMQKTREILDDLPPFCAAFFRNAANNNLSALTRYGYAVDLKGFFGYLLEHTDAFRAKKLADLTTADLDCVNAADIDRFLEDRTLYIKEDREVTNNELSRKRKLSAIRSFFKYYYKQEMIQNNVAGLIDAPRLHEKAIIRLEPNEVAEMLDHVESGSGLSDRQKKYHDATRVRDVAILTLFLGTGIRISELVGLDVNDIDFDDDSFIVTRKGGATDILSFGGEVHRALWEYAQKRADLSPIDGHEDALFLSLQNRRITVRAVEQLVKKYAAVTTPLKKITPHKLRSTYGTMLYRETQDIYLVADALGHKDVNTTRRHYAAQSQDNRRLAARKIHLRDDD